MAILATEKVLTLDYWKRAGNLVEGDYVFDRNGKIVRVKLVQNYQATECYKITFSDWLTIQGDGALKLPLENQKYRNRLDSYKGVKRFRRPLKPTSVEDLLSLPLKSKRNRLVYSVPTTQPLELPHQLLPIPPFIMGFWFFARKTNGKLSAARGMQDYVEQQFKDFGYKTKFGRKQKTGCRDFSVSPSIESQLVPNIPTKISNNYLLGSPEQRIELLRGIFCTKSRVYSQKKDRFQFSSKQLNLISQIQFLVESLGIKTSQNFENTFKHYTLFFKSRIKLIENQNSPPIKVHQSRRYVCSIDPIQPQSCVYIETTGEDNTILVGEGFISCL